MTSICKTTSRERLGSGKTGGLPPLDRHDRVPPKDMGPWLGWTEARVIELRRLREVLGLSLGQIVKVWAVEGGGPTRNAVIGACYRHGIGGAPHVPLRTPKRAKARAAQPLSERENSAPAWPEDGPKLKERPLPKLRVIKAPCPPKLLADLAATECRYPVDGEGAETLFCAAPRTTHRCYCEAHRQIAYQPTPMLSEEEIARAARVLAGDRWAA